MVEVNTGIQHKGPSKGRSLLDYSILIACVTLILLTGILVLDAFEYITVPGVRGAKGRVHNAIENTGNVDILSSKEIVDLQKKVSDAKKLLAEKTVKVEKLVIEKVEEEKKEKAKAAGVPAKEETLEEKKEKETKVEKVIEAVVQKEMGLDRFCGGCKYGAMPFSCQKRVDWMMDAYGISEDIAKESVLHKCHWRLRH